MNKLTLAIAAYQIETFISECLDSVKAQTNQNFDLLAIDDGSKDATGKLLDQYALQYPKMQVVHQSNAGISCVRNTMIDLCQTDYIWMIDGDDTLPADAVERLLPCLDGQREAVYFTYSCYGETDKRALTGRVSDLNAAQVKALRYKSMLCDSEPAIREINANSSVMCAHKVSTLREGGVRFEPGRRCGGDFLFTSMFLRAASRLAYLDASLYVYRVNEGSVSLRYQKGLTDRNLEWFSVIRTFLDAHYAGDTQMYKLFTGRVIGTAGSSILLEICHPHNPEPYARRRAQFAALAAEPEIVSALRDCPAALLNRNSKIFRVLLQHRLFFAANLFAHMIMKKRYMVFRSHGGRVKK